MRWYIKEMNKRQRENTAKYLYDISKGILLMAVVGSLIGQEPDIFKLIFGGLAAVAFFIWAYTMDGGYDNG